MRLSGGQQQNLERKVSREGSFWKAGVGAPCSKETKCRFRVLCWPRAAAFSGNLAGEELARVKLGSARAIHISLFLSIHLSLDALASLPFSARRTNLLPWDSIAATSFHWTGAAGRSKLPVYLIHPFAWQPSSSRLFRSCQVPHRETPSASSSAVQRSFPSATTATRGSMIWKKKGGNRASTIIAAYPCGNCGASGQERSD